MEGGEAEWCNIQCLPEEGSLQALCSVHHGRGMKIKIIIQGSYPLLTSLAGYRHLKAVDTVGNYSTKLLA